MKTGLFGGTFDPIHLGHLIVAEEAREQLKLERVIFVPSGIPPHKHQCGISDPVPRLEMTRLGIEGNAQFELSDFEARRQCASFTIETVRHFRQVLGEKTELFLIVGADSILDISTWREPQEIVLECQPVVVTRPGFDLSELEPWLRERVHIVESVLVSISSTDIRKRIAAGRSIRYLVPTPVASYISEHKLYNFSSST